MVPSALPRAITLAGATGGAGVVLGGADQAPDQSMLFIADAGGEEEGVPSASILAVAERQAPEPGDLDCLVVCVCEGAEEFPRVRIEGVDLAVAEVANQQVVAEFAKARRSHRQAPGRVELTVRDQATDQRARRVVDIHKSVAGAGEISSYAVFCLKKKTMPRNKETSHKIS